MLQGFLLGRRLWGGCSCYSNSILGMRGLAEKSLAGCEHVGLLQTASELLLHRIIREHPHGLSVASRAHSKLL